MSRSIELSDELYAALEAAAAASGVTPAEWLAQRVNGTATPGWPRQDLSPKTRRELFRSIMGQAHSESGDLSIRHSELCSEGMAEDHRAQVEAFCRTPLLLPAQVQDALEAAASIAGTTPAGWIAARLPAQPEPEVPYEVLEERFRAVVGRAHSGTGDLSARHSELFGEELEKQRNADRL